MKKAYYLLFYKISCFFKSLNEDGWEKWKALVIINGAEILLLVEALTWFTIITKKGIDVSKFWLIIIVLGIVIFNYFELDHNKVGEKYEEEFKSYSKKKDRLINWMVFLCLVLIAVSVVFAFYQMSLIDWSKYR